MNSDCSGTRSQMRNMENISVTESPLVQAWRDANRTESNSSLFVNICKYCFMSLGYCKSLNFCFPRIPALLKTPIGFKLASLKVTLAYYSLLKPPPMEETIKSIRNRITSHLLQSVLLPLCLLCSWLAQRAPDPEWGLWA